MRRLLLCLAVAAMVPAASVLAGPMLPGGSQVRAPRSCQGLYSGCASLCRTRMPNLPTCLDLCASKLAGCRQSGCWQDGNVGSGQLYCGVVR